MLEYEIGAVDEEPPMIAALEFLGRLTDQLFEAQMRRAARRIGARAQLFPH